MQKIELNGKVAVLHTRHYGSGWSTWAPDKYRETLSMDARIVQPVIDKDWARAAAVADELCPGVSLESVHNLAVEWVEKGAIIRIVEHDGRETIEYVGDHTLMKA